MNTFEEYWETLWAHNLKPEMLLQYKAMAECTWNAAIDAATKKVADSPNCEILPEEIQTLRI